jgi:uncharacterized protein (DUF302 family)
MTNPTRYGFNVALEIPYDKPIERVTEALKNEGFGVLTRIDVQATLREKIGAEFRRYIILGACNPVLAHQALSAELEIGLLLPCNVIVYETDQGSVVSIADPKVMMQVADNSSLAPLGDDAESRLRRALAAVAG